VLPELLRGAGLTALVLIVAGGVLYSLGALAYGFKWPDPWPGRFGFHEVFHACTVVALACQYIAVRIVACPAVLAGRLQSTRTRLAVKCHDMSSSE